mmetsp:Transcript_10552/g.15688  ORF Transcript_10552/g.15688 Transcript_10552/m.15688 type:complete len:355 (+) Transcript_10552:101-1165(+)
MKRSLSSYTFVTLALFSAKLFGQTTSFTTKTSFLIRKSASTHLSMSSSTSFMDAYSAAVAGATGNANVKLEPARGAGAGGGGGASISAAVDSDTGTKYFIKSANVSSGGGKMLKAEYLGVKEMSEANAIRVPTPIAYGEHSGRAFVIFEYLEFCRGADGAGREMGRQLALMHKKTSEQGFGFHVDNTIGATPQPNLPWVEDWADFWDTHRLGHMLKLTGDAGLTDEKVQKLRAKTKELLSHKPAPSLIHGDLWGGNKGYAKVKVNGDDEEEVVPVIFDPATYYGDREADIAMTYLFGGFGSDFYAGYEEEWPLPEGHEKRKTVYNLYHILNHEVLFGGMYRSQARGMIEEILRM